MSALNVIPVADLDDPRLLPYRNQRDAWLRAPHNPGSLRGHARTEAPDGPPVVSSTPRDSLFMAEGVLVVRTLLTSHYNTHSILSAPGRVADIEADVIRHAPNTPVYLANSELLERIVGFDLHRGLLAAGVRPPPTSPADLLRSATTLVLAEDLSNHDNLGGLFRTVAALLGPTAGVLLSPRSCDPLYRKALRVSMGHVLNVPYATLDPWPAALAEVVGAGFQVLALTTPGPGPIPEVDLAMSTRLNNERFALLVGAEGPGLLPETLRTLANPTLQPAPARLSIPMAPRVDSLNVVVAAGIAIDRLRTALGFSPRSDVS